jgi:hypothetical protein
MGQDCVAVERHLDLQTGFERMLMSEGRMDFQMEPGVRKGAL